MKRKICVVTGSRAEYGVLKPTLRKIVQSDNLELQLVVTGMHLSREFGYTLDEIVADGFSIHDCVEMLLSSDSDVGIGKSIGIGIIGMIDSLRNIDPDIVLIVGDRYEIFAVASAAMALSLPIAHISGGEITEGAMDEQIRHAITKMSHIHLVAIEENAERVRQMGEEPWRIHTVGGPWIDNINNIERIDKEELKHDLNISFSCPTILVTYHSVTLELSSIEQHISNLLEALHEIDAEIVFTAPNADAGGRKIIKAIEKFTDTHPNSSFFKSLGAKRYINMLSYVDLLVGNSSSGMVETQSFKLPVINIGNRQKGRIVTDNIISTSEEKADILEAMKKGLSDEFRKKIADMKDPYDKGNVAEHIVNVLSSVEMGPGLIRKKFIDIGAK